MPCSCGSVLHKDLTIILQTARIDGYNLQNSRKDTAFTWTDVYEKNPNISLSTLGTK